MLLYPPRSIAPARTGYVRGASVAQRRHHGVPYALVGDSLHPVDDTECPQSVRLWRII